MTSSNKHASRSAQTREIFVRAAQRLYAERSIDAVSLNEITVAAGQKNRNALQYHFGNRDGLLQAIIDTHAERVSTLREQYLKKASTAEWSKAEASARVFVAPLTDYAQDNPEGVYYIKILSQLAATNSPLTNPASMSRLSLRSEPALGKLMHEAMSHLSAAEAQRRIFLLVSMAFHSIAEACSVAEATDASKALQNRAALFNQVICSIAAFIAAPARE